jgi:hypothetical protein
MAVGDIPTALVLVFSVRGSCEVGREGQLVLVTFLQSPVLTQLPALLTGGDQMTELFSEADSSGSGPSAEGLAREEGCRANLPSGLV